MVELAPDVARVVGYGGTGLTAFVEVAGADSEKLDEPGTWTLREVSSKAEVEIAAGVETADGVTVITTV